jgi:hypothetical protein
MLSELHSLNLKLYSKEYNKKFVLHLIVAPQLSRGWQHNYSTKTRQAGQANEQSMYSLMSMATTLSKVRNFYNFLAIPSVIRFNFNFQVNLGQLCKVPFNSVLSKVKTYNFFLKSLVR